MEFLGTKGKWRLELFNGKGNVIDIYVDKEIDNDVVAQVYSLQETSYNEPFNEEMKANAKLIECAPEMLEMLKYSAEALKAINSFGATKPIIERLENTIKKATTL